MRVFCPSRWKCLPGAPLKFPKFLFPPLEASKSAFGKLLARKSRAGGAQGAPGGRCAGCGRPELDHCPHGKSVRHRLGQALGGDGHLGPLALGHRPRPRRPFSVLPLRCKSLLTASASCRRGPERTPHDERRVRPMVSRREQGFEPVMTDWCGQSARSCYTPAPSGLNPVP